MDTSSSTSSSPPSMCSSTFSASGYGSEDVEGTSNESTDLDRSAAQSFKSTGEEDEFVVVSSPLLL